MWMADLDAVLQLHLVQLNKETDGMCVVFDVEWLFVHGTRLSSLGLLRLTSFDSSFTFCTPVVSLI